MTLYTLYWVSILKNSFFHDCFKKLIWTLGYDLQCTKCVNWWAWNGKWASKQTTLAILQKKNKNKNKTKVDERWPFLSRILVPPEYCTLFSPPPTSYIFKNFVSIPSIFKENKTKPTVKEKNKLKGSPKLGNISPDIRLQNCNLLIHEQYEQQLPSSLNDQRHQQSTLCSEEKNTKRVIAGQLAVKFKHSVFLFWKSII